MQPPIRWMFHPSARDLARGSAIYTAHDFLEVIDHDASRRIPTLPDFRAWLVQSPTTAKYSPPIVARRRSPGWALRSSKSRASSRRPNGAAIVRQKGIGTVACIGDARQRPSPRDQPEGHHPAGNRSSRPAALVRLGRGRRARFSLYDGPVARARRCRPLATAIRRRAWPRRLRRDSIGGVPIYCLPRSPALAAGLLPAAARPKMVSRQSDERSDPFSKNSNPDLILN
ncbi:hypothetical protein ACVILL_000231 [Bradyrhizobium sp. USDA 3364]